MDNQLPAEALAAAKQGVAALHIAQRYPEPLVALQDNDLTLPEGVSFAYYAI